MGWDTLCVFVFLLCELGMVALLCEHVAYVGFDCSKCSCRSAAVAAWWGVKAAAENEMGEEHRAVHVFDALAMNGIQETRKRPIPCGS